MYIKLKEQEDLFKVEVVYQNKKIEKLQEKFHRKEDYKDLTIISGEFRERIEGLFYGSEYRLIIYSEHFETGYALMLATPAEMWWSTYAKTLYDDILQELNKIDFEILFPWLEKNIEEFDKILTLASRKNDDKKEEHIVYLKNALNELQQKNNYFAKQMNAMWQEKITKQKRQVDEVKDKLRMEQEKLEDLRKNIRDIKE